MTFAIVLERDDPLPVPEVGPGIARAAGLATADTTRTLRRSRGIVKLGLDEAAAEEAVRILAVAGRAARAVPEEDLPALPPARALRHADLLQEGLRIPPPDGGEPTSIPWERIGLAAVGFVTLARRRSRRAEEPRKPSWKKLPRGLLVPLDPTMGALSLAKPRPKPALRPAVEKVESGLVLDLLLREPEDRLRIVSSRFAYDYLEDRIGLTSKENFRTLVEDLARLAPDVLLAGSTLSFLEDTRPGTHHFDELAQLDDYLRWMIAWREVFGGGRADDAQSSSAG